MFYLMLHSTHFILWLYGIGTFLAFVIIVICSSKQFQNKGNDYELVNCISSLKQN